MYPHACAWEADTLTASRLTAPAKAVAAKPAVRAADGLENKFRLVTLSFQRARQLQNGARPRVESGSHKPARVAMLEVQAGLISWSAEAEPDQQAKQA